MRSAIWTWLAGRPSSLCQMQRTVYYAPDECLMWMNVYDPVLYQSIIITMEAVRVIIDLVSPYQYHMYIVLITNNRYNQ